MLGSVAIAANMCQRVTAESACGLADLSLLSVVQAAGPVDGDVRGAVVQPRRAVNRASSAAADPDEKKSVGTQFLDVSGMSFQPAKRSIATLCSFSDLRYVMGERAVR